MVAAISQIFKNFALNTEAKVVFEEMNTKLIDITQSEYGFIGEVFNDGTQDFLKTHAITNIAWNKETRDFYETNAPEGLEFKNLKSLFGHVITTGKPVISNNPYEDDRRGGLPEGHPHMGSFLGLPILLQGKFIGMVGMANRPGGYNETLCQELKPYLSACASLIEGYKLVKQKAEARKDLETSLLKLKNQNEKLSEFTYIVSHDVRKHASNLKMLVEMHDASNKSEVMQMIASTTNHLFTTVDYISEIIEVTQKPSLRRREINLSELVTDIFSSFEIELKEFSVQLNIEEAITIMAEPAYLNSIFENLLSNAIKYCRHDSKTIEVSAVIQNQTALITVKDYGRGIDMARHGEKLFQMFSTFHGSSDSKGLGLYLVKKYIDSMKGKISVDSSISLNSYTIFNIEIPI